jgi:ABC-2 type transport system ATP-binding protein
VSDSAPAIRCERLLKRYGDLLAVAGIDLEVKRGTCFGLLGPNGAGKTTTVEMLEGLHAPTSGRIQLFGLEWGSGRDQELRERIGVQLQNTELGDKLHVDEVLRLFRSFYRRGRDPESLLDLIDLRESRHQQFSRLSGGQKQRVALATALAGSPDLLFLDEPTTGLDPRARQSLWKIVEAFRAEGGSVLLTTHYMEEAQSLCDEIAIMDHGRLIAQGTPRALVDALGDVQFLEFELGPSLDEAQIAKLPGVEAVQRRGPRYRVRLGRSLAQLGSVLAELERQNVVPIGLSTHQATLDDVFLQLTGRGLHDENGQTELLPKTSSG